tara:strand:+ start:266 stop:610 length:345 start_codon:yes stop_codon:yes gene_type:complete
MRDHPAEDIGEDGRLFDGGIAFFIDHDLQVTSSGTLFIHSTIEVGEIDRLIIVKPFYEIIGDIIDNVEDDYVELYSIANELIRAAERLRDLAQRIEDSETTIAGLFDTDYGPPA